MPPTRYPVPNPADRLSSGINAFDDLADTIANPPAGRPLKEAIGLGGQRYCDFLGSVPGAASGLLGPGYVVGGLLCKPYWDKNGYDPPGETFPFAGGQCPVRYGLRTYRADGEQVGNTLFVFGPVTALSVVKVSGILERTTFSGFTAGGAPLTATRDRGTQGNEPAGSAVVYRPDGQPDNCGNPAGTPTPGANPPPTPVYPPGEGPGVDETGQPYFPVPPIDSPVPGGDPIDVPIDPGPPPDPAPPGPPPGGGDPGDGGTATPGTDAEDEAPPGKMLWGLRITVAAAPPGARQYAPGVYRAVCYVYMGDDDGLDHDPAGAMLRSGQFVLAERDYLTKWRVTANPGYTLDVVPYYKDIEEKP